MKKILMYFLIVNVLIVGVIGLSACSHEHTFSEAWESDETSHWHESTCDHFEEKSGLEAHSYKNVCADRCEVCGRERITEGHKYDNECDATCNNCGETREVAGHTYSHDCAEHCSKCNETRTTTTKHQYNKCDKNCAVCGEERVVEHKYSNACDSSCDICGFIRDIPGHQYDGDEDAICNNCQQQRKLERKVQVCENKTITYDGNSHAPNTVNDVILSGLDGLVQDQDYTFKKYYKEINDHGFEWVATNVWSYAGEYKTVVEFIETDLYLPKTIETYVTINKLTINKFKYDVIYMENVSYYQIYYSDLGIMLPDDVYIRIYVNSNEKTTDYVSVNHYTLYRGNNSYEILEDVMIKIS